MKLTTVFVWIIFAALIGNNLKRWFLGIEPFSFVTQENVLLLSLFFIFTIVSWGFKKLTKGKPFSSDKI
mgnify:CR=1 FL=1